MTAPSYLPDDELLARFFKEYAQAAVKDEVLARYAAAHPGRAAEFRELADMDRLMVSTAEEAEHPKRLGEFRIVRHLVSGGMGDVYEAVQESLGRRVAVKTIRRGRLSPEAEARFLREQTVLAALHQTHIVPIHTGGKEQKLQYFAMPFIDGETVQNLIHALRDRQASRPADKTPSLGKVVGTSATDSTLMAGSTTGSSFPAIPARPGLPDLSHSRAYYDSVAQVIIEAAEALQHAHDVNILHRDMKPSNLMVDRTGQCWIIDFGLAGLLRGPHGPEPVRISLNLGPEETLTRSGILGTPQYMAPEQWRGEAADVRTDVWGLGTTLYELLTLCPAFAGQTMEALRDQVLGPKEATPPRKMVHNLPGDLDAICRKALRKAPQERYASARALADDLRRWQRSESTTARPGLARAVWLWACRNKGWSTAIVVGLLAFIGLTVAEIRAANASASAAQVKTVAATQQERDRRRESLVQQLQLLRLSPHRAGWSRNGLDLVQQAGVLRLDNDLRDQAAAVLHGFDARLAKQFKTDDKNLFDACSVAIDSNDGDLCLLMGGIGSPARLWKQKTDKLLTSTRSGTGPVAFRPDHTPVHLVVDRTDPGRLILWDVAKDNLVSELKVPPKMNQIARVDHLALATDGSTVAAASANPGVVIVWNQNGKLLRHIEVTGSPITALALAPDGSYVAVGDEDGRVSAWPLPEGDPIVLPAAGRTHVNCLAFGQLPRWRTEANPSRKTPLLASGYGGGMVVVWDLGRQVTQAYCRGSWFDVYSLAFSPDGTRLASAGRYTTRLWDTATGRLLLSLDRGDFIQGLAFSRDGRFLAAGMESHFGKGGVLLWDLEPGRGIRTLRGLTTPVSKVYFSPQGEWIAALAHDWQVAIWDQKTGALRHLLDVPQGVTADNAALAFSPDGRRFAFAAGTEARLWDLERGTIQSWKLPMGLLDALAFDATGKKLLLFRMELGDRTRSLVGNNHPRLYPRVCRIRDLLASPQQDLRKAAQDPTVKEIDHFNWHGFWAVAAPDGSYFVAQGLHGQKGEESTYRVFASDTGKTLWSLPAPGASTIVIDPPGKHLFLPGDGGVGSLVEMPSGKLLRNLHGGAHALAPQAHFLGQPQMSGFGFDLLSSEEKKLVTLAIDVPASSVVPSFNSEGNLVAWGNQDGTVHVADIPEVQRQLAALELGW